MTPEQFQRSLDLRTRVIHRVTLQTQMRCEGGRTYIEYLDSIFQISQKENLHMENYDFKIWDDPNAMIKDIRTKEKDITLCRVVAGYSWKWKSNNTSLKI